MSILSQNAEIANEVSGTVERFLKDYQVGSLLRKCNASKEKGVPVMDIFRYKLNSMFMDRSLYMQLKTGSYREPYSKNTFYRFLNSVKTNWLRFTSLLASAVINQTVKGLTGENRADVFIIDDSMYERSGYKRTELASRVFDHVDMRYKKGFRLLTLGWSDGNTFLPVNSCLLASAKEANILGTTKPLDKRSLAGKRRILAQKKAPSVMLDLLDAATASGIRASYVLFDCWFANPAQVLSIKDRGMDVICMIKKSSRIKYEYEGKRLSIKQIFDRATKRRGRSRYLLSVNVKVGKENSIPAKIVCVRNHNKRKDWLASLCTDISLSEDEIIRIYGKRWQIEVFFKTCKSTLSLNSECHSISYDALTAHVAVVFVRFLLLSLEQRKSEDQRTLGELFFLIADELADITFSESLLIIVDAMTASLQELLKLSDEQLNDFVCDFENRLPEYIRKALHRHKAA